MTTCEDRGENRLTSFLFKSMEIQVKRGFQTNSRRGRNPQPVDDEELARAIIDRTLHHGEYLKLAGSSYRLQGRKIELDLPSIAQQSTATQGGDIKSES
jgi:hypothetical protein